MLRGPVVVLITTPESEAERIARTLVEERLAACVNIVKGVTSIYWWRGNVESDSEALLIVKTSAGILPRLEEKVREIHPYEVPEIIVLPIIAGLKDYLEWLEGEVKEGGAGES